MVKISDIKWKEEEPSSLRQFLRMMYFFGFLPINWMDHHREGEQCMFEISRTKTILLFILDFFLASIIPAYTCVWHWLNIDGFDLRQLLTVKYYLDLNGGNATNTLCQLVYVVFPSCVFWIFITVGKIIHEVQLSSSTNRLF